MARLTSKFFKPRNRLLHWLDDEITKSRLKLTSKQLKLLFRRRFVHLGEQPDFERGYVALEFKKKIAGCGFWTGQKLRTQVSKGLAAQFPSAAF